MVTLAEFYANQSRSPSLFTSRKCGRLYLSASARVPIETEARNDVMQGEFVFGKENASDTKGISGRTQ